MWSLFSRSHPWLHPEDWNLTLGHSAGFEGDENARRHRLPRHPGHRQWRQWIWREQAVGELCSEILLKAQQGASLEALSALQDGPWLVRLLARNLSSFCKVVNVYDIFSIDIFSIDILELSSILAHIWIGWGSILSWNCPLWSPRLGPNLQIGSMVRIRIFLRLHIFKDNLPPISSPLQYRPLSSLVHLSSRSHRTGRGMWPSRRWRWSERRGSLWWWPSDRLCLKTIFHWTDDQVKTFLWKEEGKF